MIIHGKHIRMFISWLRHIVKTIAFRSYRNLLSVILRLIRHCQSVVNGKEGDFREAPGLALSSQPATDRSEPTPPVSLAVPLLEVPLQGLHGQGSQPGMSIQNMQMPIPELHGGSNDAAFNTDTLPNSYAPLMPSSMPEPSTLEVGVATPPPLAVPGQTITLTPIVPDQSNRYKRNVRVKDEFEVFLIQKGPLDCLEELAAVEGWEPLTHPEGSLFFYHPYQRVFTDANLRDPETAVKLAKAVEKVYEEAHSADIFLHPSVELALELIVKDGSESWGYYFADHERRVIFWFEDHESHSLMNAVRGVECKSHIKYALESQYWHHIKQFPNKRFLPEDVVVELKELLMYAQADYIIRDTYLTHFTADEVASLLGLMDFLMGESYPDTVLTRSVNPITEARLMRLCCDAKFKNFCGQPGARLDVDQSLYGTSYDLPRLTRIFLRILNVILFRGPNAQMKSIQKIWVDETIIWPRWTKFRDRLTTEWNGYAIFSTVMLAVDISFLAVPIADAGRTIVFIIIYLSVLCILGSLTSTLFLVGQVNDSLRGTTGEVANYIRQMSYSFLGLRGLAVMLSLPSGLLHWGMILFTLALCIMVAIGSNSGGILIIYSLSPVIFILSVVQSPMLGLSVYTWYCNTERQISRLWHRIKEQVSRTVTTPSHVV
ncbi:hypothetical protein DEU56DRAFT_944095, partial [Suillus clintonianus]|uniref:uncharacterized protein n=1 Tax=Suillus clintonianus TaxID=1904413 RepID=UPI001B87404E